MRHRIRILFQATFVLCALALVGCGKSSVELKGPNDDGLPAEAVAVRKAFEDAEPSYQNPVNEALGMVKAGASNPAAYREAVTMLQRLASNPTITEEQKQALETLIQRVKSDLSGSK